MVAALVQFGVSALVIIGAGVFLTKSADRLAEETGLGKVIVGSILLAGATSLPELMVDINAIWLDQPDLAVGDLLGSSLLNLLILAVVDTAFRHPRRAFSSEFAQHAGNAVLSINLTALVGVGILSQLYLSIFGVGLFIWFVVGVYFVGLSLNFRLPAKDGGGRLKGRILNRSMIEFVASAGVILVAAPYLVRSADQVARLSGLGHTFIGTTLVALATSLPELVTTIAAFRIGAPDLALGNIFGSNTFNMILFFPLDALYPGALLQSVRPAHALTAFCVVAVSSVAVMGQISSKREKVRLWEPSSPLIVLIVIGSLYLLYRVR